MSTRMNSFYEEVSNLVGDKADTLEAPHDAVIVLFRVAFEFGSKHYGISGIIHLLSTLLTSSLEVLAEEDSKRDAHLFNKLDMDGWTPN